MLNMGSTVAFGCHVGLGAGCSLWPCRLLLSRRLAWAGLRLRQPRRAVQVVFDSIARRVPFAQLLVGRRLRRQVLVFRPADREVGQDRARLVCLSAGKQLIVVIT